MTNAQSFWSLIELQALVKRATSATSVRISLRASLDHQSNNLYDAWADDKHLIIKEYLKAEEWNDSPAREFRALELLAPLDIAPRAVHYEPPLPPRAPLVIYEYLVGEMWNRRKPTPAQLAQLAEVWLRFNALPVENLWMSRNFGQSLETLMLRFHARFEAYAAWASANFAEGQRAAELCLHLLSERRPVALQLQSMSPPLCFCRADPRFANIIQRPSGRVAYVDWEDAGLRDPAIDVADILMGPNQEDLLTAEEWQSFLRPYLAAHGSADPNLWERAIGFQALFQLYFLSMLVNVGLELIQAGQRPQWKANGLPANLRLKRYLARALAWPASDFSRQLSKLSNVEFFPCASFFNE